MPFGHLSHLQGCCFVSSASWRTNCGLVRSLAFWGAVASAVAMTYRLLKNRDDTTYGDLEKSIWFLVVSRSLR